jgi:hypothetical protein
VAEVVKPETYLLSLAENACLDRCGTKILLNEDRSREWFRAFETRARENEVLISRIRCPFPPGQQEASQKRGMGTGAFDAFDFGSLNRPHTYARRTCLSDRLSGIGQAGAMFLGQGSLNQPLSESDLMRERAASNIGETGDEEVSRLAVNQQIVVTVPAGLPIYVVLQQTPKSNQPPTASGARSSPAATAANMDQLRQLLQLQQEMNQSIASNPTPQ